MRASRNMLKRVHIPAAQTPKSLPNHNLVCAEVVKHPNHIYYLSCRKYVALHAPKRRSAHSDTSLGDIQVASAAPRARVGRP